MRILLFLAAALAVFAPFAVAAQDKTVTIMIFRHAEKEAPVEGDETEPDLSLDGQRRAVRLAFLLEKYKPKRVLSTKYARTMQTVTPLARINKLDVEIYDPSDLKSLAKRLAAADPSARSIAVGGHSNTSYQLVNLILGQDKYKKQDESDYGKLWIIRIKKGKITDTLIEY